MVKIAGYNLRTSQEGKAFLSFILQGGIEVVNPRMAGLI
jgi:hypothetical protein